MFVLIRRALASGLLVVTLGSCDSSPREGHRSQERTNGPSASAAFDPFAFDEPRYPAFPSEGQPSVAQMDRLVRYLADAYTYALRTGFTVRLDRADGAQFGLSEDVRALTADDLHAVMPPAQVRIVKRSPPTKVGSAPSDGGTWSAFYLIEIVRRPGSVEDRAGEVVRPLRRRVFSLAVEVVWNSRGVSFVSAS